MTDTSEKQSTMKLKVTPFHPEAQVHKEDPVYRFTVVENGRQVAFLFNAPVSLLRANGGQDDYRKVAISLLNEANFSLDDITSIVNQLEEEFREIVAGRK